MVQKIRGNENLKNMDRVDELKRDQFLGVED
jgi:hypothetical protein